MKFEIFSDILYYESFDAAHDADWRKGCRGQIFRVLIFYLLYFSEWMSHRWIMTYALFARALQSATK